MQSLFLLQAQDLAYRVMHACKFHHLIKLFEFLLFEFSFLILQANGIFRSPEFNRSRKGKPEREAYLLLKKIPGWQCDAQLEFKCHHILAKR